MTPFPTAPAIMGSVCLTIALFNPGAKAYFPVIK
jgi:hypothetical protein